MPLTALVVIWGFAAKLTIEQGQQLLRIQKVYDNIVYPVSEAINQLQSERFVSVSYLAWRTSSLRTDLQVQRRKTDATAVLLTRLSAEAQDETPPAMWDRVQDLLRQMDRLDVLRGQIDDQRLTRLDAIEEYSATVEAAHQVYDRLMISPDIDIIEQTKALILITRSRELVSQQSALVLGAQASGRMTQDERDAFSGMVGKRRLLYQLGTSQLDAGLIKQYGTLNSTPLYTSFISLENDVIARVRPGQPLPPEAIAWPTTAQSRRQSISPGCFPGPFGPTADGGGDGP
ncbi:nitrate- and nitrite sensing domain-containing protein [Microbispora sp. NPDC049633]|uniref:nitrate- and nitrite sensing domain-containing protein n=1 Tax=Microbispora sp. NPDC049633 TaxID=3154355 RepID=UPI00341C7993